MIGLQNISFHYDDGVEVLNNISLEVLGGEFVGILGPNGSGKTTLIKIISGQLKAQTGFAKANDVDIRSFNHRDLGRTIAVVPQETAIPFQFSTLEVVLMGRAPYMPLFGFETEEDIKIAKEAMTSTDVVRLADRNIQELSGGEKQRVIVARALAQQPKILILDEPTTFLDIRHQMDLYQLIRKKNHEDKLTVITVLHDINLASTFCDRIVFLKSGKIVADGLPQEVVTYHKIKEVFETEVFVGINDLTGNPYYVPFNNKFFARRQIS